MHKIKAPIFGAFLLLAFLTETWALTQDVNIQYVIDGDTVVLDSGHHVRLIGLNAPEKNSSQEMAEPFALEAQLALEEILSAGGVKMEEGVESRDRYGRILASLYVENQNVQEAMIRRGYAFAIAYPPNIQHIELYGEAESEARSKKLGLWHKTAIHELLNNAKITPGQFVILKSSVHSIESSDRYDGVLMTLENQLELRIYTQNHPSIWNHIDWTDYSLQDVEVRGWVAGKGSQKYISILHPFMLRIL